MDLLQTLEYSGTGTKADLSFSPSMGWVPHQFVVALKLSLNLITDRIGFIQ